MQEKRLFSYILDRQIRVKVTTHALRCIDKAGGIDEYLLKTPHHKMDTEMGLFWKVKIEKMYQDLGGKQVVFFAPEDEASFEEKINELRLEQKAGRRDARRKMYGLSAKQEPTKDETDVGKASELTTSRNEDGSSHTDFHEPLVANA